MYSAVSGWMEWGASKPYRATDIPLETETVDESEAVTEAAPTQVQDTSEEISPDPLPTEELVQQEELGSGLSSWLNYNTLNDKIKNIDYDKLKANMDYSKISTKVGTVVNKDNMQAAGKGLGSYLSGMYGSVKTSVEGFQQENGIPLISEFEAEQAQFVKLQQRREGAAVPPWVGYNEEEKMKKQIMNLSQDERNALRDPPAGAEYHFDFDSNSPIALAMLEVDPKLSDLRFSLVPKRIPEEKFWRNYFYRVSLIKQSSQLITLEEGGPSVEQSAVKPAEEEESLPDEFLDSHDAEFVSDHLSGFEDELSESELKQIGLAAKSLVPDPNEEWEKELAKELQDFDLVEDADDELKLDDDNFEAELEEMLQQNKEEA